VSAKIFASLKWREEHLTIGRTWRELRYNRSFDRAVFLDQKSWELRAEKPGGFVATYTLAFVAVARLIETRGLPAAIEYLKTGDFEKSFGRSFADFETELENSMTEKLRAKEGFSIDKPEWLVGFRWKYEVRESNKASERTDEIVDTVVTANGPAFLLRNGNEETVRSMDDMRILELRKNGAVLSRFDQSGKLFAWPLVAEKQWTTTYNVEDPDSKKTRTVQRVRFVAGSELVHVPAGTFKAVKLEFYAPRTGRLLGEYWYSPETRWFVKTVSYESVNAYYREERLVSYKLDNQIAATKK
jgi:hypothetical protein